MFASYAQRGWQNLKEKEQIINDMNVFPVSDGDTGTNMRLTLENGLKEAAGTARLDEYLARLAHGMLLGARGNSGVIFSQWMKGIADALADKETADAAELANAFLSGARTAYAAVLRPTEGTILTVAREAAEDTLKNDLGHLTAEALLDCYLLFMRQSLRHTPDQLAVLREAGVLDSGAYGLVTFMEGFSPSATEETAPFAESTPFMRNAFPSNEPLVNGDGALNCGFCTEFVLRVEEDFCEEEALKLYLDSMGDSLVFIRDGSVVKAHVHTDEPLAVLNYAARHGEFLNIKVENLREMCQTAAKRRENVRVSAGRKDITFIAVTEGDGFRELFREIGCDFIMERNPSEGIPVASFLKMFASVPEGKIVVLPNDRNIAAAAMQAAQLFSESERVEVLETASLAEGYYRMSLLDLTETDPERLLKQLRATVGCMETVFICEAVAQRALEGITVTPGDTLALNGKHLLGAGKSRLEVAEKALAAFTDTAEAILIFYGSAVTEEEAQALAETLSDARPDLEVGVFFGGQTSAMYVIGIIA